MDSAYKLVQEAAALRQGVCELHGRCVDSVIGFGASGPVVTAEYHGNAVALKCRSLPAGSGAGGQASPAQLPPHPNVVHTLKHVRSATHVFEVRELCGGGDLMDSVMLEGGLEPQTALRHFDELCSAVAHVHSHGRAFGRMRAEKVLLSCENVLRLLPAAAASNIDSASPEPLDAPELLEPGSPAAGSSGPPSLSSESSGDLSSDAARADVWSCAVMFCVMVCGEPPETVGALHRVDADGIGALPQVASCTPHELHGLLREMLSLDPARRPSASDCHAAIARVREGAGAAPPAAGDDADRVSTEMASLDRARGFGSYTNLEALAPSDEPKAQPEALNAKRKRDSQEVLNCLGFVRSGSATSNEL